MNTVTLKYHNGKINLCIFQSYLHLSDKIGEAIINILTNDNNINLQKISTQRNTAFIIETENEKLIIKVYFHGGLTKFLLPPKWFLNNRGMSEFLFYHNNLSKLSFVPQYIGAFWIKKFCFYITGTISQYIENSKDIKEVITSSEIEETQKKKLLQKAGEIIRNMHEHRINHKDLHLKNILVQFTDNSSDCKYKIYIIDFDKSIKEKKTKIFWKSMNLLRLKRYFIKNKLPTKYFNYILEGYNIDRLSTLAQILSFPHLVWAKIKSYG